MKKLTAAGVIAGAALGAVLMAGPAQAHDDGGHKDGLTVQSNENEQLIPIQLCNTNVAVLGIVNSEGESCYNGSQQGNLDK